MGFRRPHFYRDTLCTLSTCHQIWWRKTTKQGSVRLVLKFRQPSNKNVSVIAYAEFENVLEIDRNRNVIYDFSV